MNFRAVSVIAFYNEQQNVLLQDRKGMGKRGEWGFFGGGIESGETPEQAIVREIREELSYELSNYAYVGKAEYRGNDYSRDLYVFVAPAPAESRIQQKEGAGRKFFSLIEARSLRLAESDHPILDLLVKYFVTKH